MVSLLFDEKSKKEIFLDATQLDSEAATGGVL